MLSIIIPTLNAEATLAATLDPILAAAVPGLDLGVVDGGSNDATRSIAAERGAKVLTCQAGRGRQLVCGANATTAEWLLFLHADTRLPQSWPEDVSRFITADANQQRAAYFRLSFDDESAGAKRVAALANWRAKVLGLPYGDQGLLIHRTLYDEVGGFDARLTLMEDVELARRIGPMRLKRLPGCVVTSAAKYRTGGWWLRPFKNLLCLGLYLAGAPLAWIERLYK
ncbi:MAG: TIGR04283 family arsenosugar biosynthesis glycosyltransferase [Rhodospirillales bacterium]|nr:TIGR04283 family arsenosugar biosynthesis glycosyltransferase [Rhodospirillales bacterium]